MKNARIALSALLLAAATFGFTACGGSATAEPRPVEHSKAVTDLVGEAVNDANTEIKKEVRR